MGRSGFREVAGRGNMPLGAAMRLACFLALGRAEDAPTSHGDAEPQALDDNASPLHGAGAATQAPANSAVRCAHVAAGATVRGRGVHAGHGQDCLDRHASLVPLLALGHTDRTAVVGGRAQGSMEPLEPCAGGLPRREHPALRVRELDRDGPRLATLRARRPGTQRNPAAGHIGTEPTPTRENWSDRFNEILGDRGACEYTGRHTTSLEG